MEPLDTLTPHEGIHSNIGTWVFGIRRGTSGIFSTGIVSYGQIGQSFPSINRNFSALLSRCSLVILLSVSSKPENLQVGQCIIRCLMKHFSYSLGTSHSSHMGNMQVLFEGTSASGQAAVVNY